MDARTPEDILRDAGGKTDRTASPRDFLSAEAWLERDIPQPDRLLGDLLTTTSRIFLVGRTGMGKTLVGIGIACGIASGRGFLHWHCHRAARVLVVDGEMPAELIQSRVRDALRRVGAKMPPGNLVIFARDLEEEFAKRFPTVGRMAPLNTEEGRKWLIALIDAIGDVDVVIFDNVMSLLAGDQKDEVSWSDALDLVQSLTAKQIGQVWLDHTGHNQDRQYGSSTKAWRFDAVGIMAPLPEDEREDHEVAFTLSFDHPGKARRRTPDNWRDFETRTIRLADDEWTSESAANRPKKAARISPAAQQFFGSLHDALATTATPGTTTRSAWYAECARVGLVEPTDDRDDYRTRDIKRRPFRKYLMELKGAGLVGIDGENVTDLGAER